MLCDESARLQLRAGQELIDHSYKDMISKARPTSAACLPVGVADTAGCSRKELLSHHVSLHVNPHDHEGALQYGLHQRRAHYKNSTAV